VIRLCEPCDRNFECHLLAIGCHRLRYKGFCCVREGTADLDAPFDLESAQQAGQRFKPGGSDLALRGNVSKHLVAKLDRPEGLWL